MRFLLNTLKTGWMVRAGQGAIVLQNRDKTDRGKSDNTTDMDKLARYEKEIQMSRHLAAERYEHAMQMVGESRRQNMVARGHYNLTRNKILSYDIYVKNLYKPASNMNYDMAFSAMMDLSYTDEDRQRLEAKLDRQHVLQAYEKGETSIQVRYRRILPGSGPIWIGVVMDSFVNPRTGDIEGLSFGYDITAQVLEEAIINRLGSLGYDELGIVYSNSGYWRCYQYIEASEKEHGQLHNSGPWDTEIERYLREEVVSEQQGKARYELSLPVILAKLEKQAVYACRQTVQRTDGSFQQKEIKFAYLNEVRETIFYCMSDITEQFTRDHEQIAALEAAREAAESANETRAAFFASISHDMRTPLNGVLGYTDLALEAKDWAGAKEYLSKIRISGQLLLELINDVLDFGKYVSHKIELKLEPIHIESVCRAVETVIRPLADQKGILFRMERQQSYTGLVLSDALRLQQLLVNLLSNAVKFTRRGGLVECLLDEKETGQTIACQMVVRDNGVGMSAKFLPRIFDPYSQEERASASKTMGTGLGMAIVKQIVDLMGGQITVDSTVDVGTTFTVRLVLQKYTGEDIPQKHSIGKTYMEVLDGKRVLLCEDNELNAEIATLLLEHWGMKVTWKENGRQALAAMQLSPADYDIILMDKRMPVMDGLEATKGIRDMECGKERHIPIVAMTGDVDEDSIQSCLDAGMDQHVGKPINREELARAMVSLL